MHIIFYSSIVALLLSNLGQCAELKCGDQPQDQTILPRQYSYDVAGTGRLYIYPSPEKNCLDKNLFVVPGDNVTAYSEFGPNGEWTSISYLSSSGRTYKGWVQTNRLRFVGASGNEMTPEKIQLYQKAAREAQQGKLGHPAEVD